MTSKKELLKRIERLEAELKLGPLTEKDDHLAHVFGDNNRLDKIENRVDAMEHYHKLAYVQDEQKYLKDDNKSDW